MSARRALVIAAVLMRRTLRDRVSLFFILALPVMITFFVGVSVFSSGRGFALGVVAPDDEPLARELVARLERDPALTVTRFEDAAELRRGVRRGLVAAGVTIPRGYAAGAGGPGEIEYVADPARAAQAGARAAVAAVVSAQALEVRGVRTRAIEVGTDMIQARGGTVLPAGFSYPAAANVILFMFITSLSIAAGVVHLRTLGLARRILSTPTTRATLVAGQLLGRLGIALFQGAFILVFGALVFGVRFGDPLGAAALIGAFALVAVSVGILFGTLSRTAEQAGALAAPLGIALGMLGGCMWPLEVVPPAMRVVGHLTPHAWAMDAFVALMAKGADLPAIAPQVAILVGYAALLLPIATWRLRAAVARTD